MNRTKKRWYAYRWDDERDREVTVRGNYEDNLDNLTFSRTNPQERKMKRTMYEERIIGGPNATGDYQDPVEWGKLGGRPRQWENDAQRMRAKRTQNKLATGQPLTYEEKELLGLIKKRPGAYQSGLGRPMTPTERQRARRARLKGT